MLLRGNSICGYKKRRSGFPFRISTTPLCHVLISRSQTHRRHRQRHLRDPVYPEGTGTPLAAMFSFIGKATIRASNLMYSFLFIDKPPFFSLIYNATPDTISDGTSVPPKIVQYCLRTADPRTSLSRGDPYGRYPSSRIHIMCKSTKRLLSYCNT